MFRGWLRLNGIEVCNTSRVVAHVGAAVPTVDSEVFGAADCSLTPAATGLYEVPASSTAVAPGLYTIPAGSRRYDPGLLTVGECWPAVTGCGFCRPRIVRDDSWDGLRAWLGDSVYRLELAPWYSTRVPESGEFAGVWLLDAKGFGTAETDRPVTESVGSGGSAGPHRDRTRLLSFSALLVACSEAGLTFGLEWLAWQLRETKSRDDSVLRYLCAHPGGSDADPDDLVRELHAVVQTKSPVVDERWAFARGVGATMCTVSWELTALCPYPYLPAFDAPAAWDTTATETVSWVHAAGCVVADESMPVLFSEDCTPEVIDVVTVPPPVCGGCLPVAGVTRRTWVLPTREQPVLSHDTAVSLHVTNTGERALTVQLYLRECFTGDDVPDRFPLQVSGLPARAVLHCDAVRGRFWAELDGVVHRPVGIVGTPDGRPWLPAVIDRSDCWELVALSADDAAFTVSVTLTDRGA